jgi:ABC-type Fe3+ transport system permease subunit/streptogramin lyase
MNWALVQNSLVVGISTTAIAVVFGTVSALWLSGLPERTRTFFLASAVLALALPPFLVTNCWLHFLGRTGVWHSWLPFDIFSIGGTVWILSLLLWPLTLLLVWGAWQRLEASQLESDMMVTGWALLRGLLLPLARGAIAQAALITLVLAFNNFAVPAILQVKVFPAEMWVRFNTTFDTWGALQLSWPLVLGPLLFVLWFANREVPWPHAQPPVAGRLFRQQLGPAWFWGCGICSLLVGTCSVLVPLYQILSLRRTWTELPGALAAGQSAVWNSLWYAMAAATVVVGASLWATSYGETRRPKSEGRRAEAAEARSPKPEGRNPNENFVLERSLPTAGVFEFALRISAFGLRIFSALAWLAFLLPGVLLGIGFIHVFNHDWTSMFYQSSGIVIFAFVIRYLAIGWRGTGVAAKKIDRDLIDVARLEGATAGQMLRYVLWPQIARPVLVTWYVVFVLCLWDVESIILVVPPGGETLALRIFNLLHYGHNAQVNALCLLLLVLALTPLILARLFSLARLRSGRGPGSQGGTGGSVPAFNAAANSPVLHSSAPRAQRTARYLCRVVGWAVLRPPRAWMDSISCPSHGARRAADCAPYPRFIGRTARPASWFIALLFSKCRLLLLASVLLLLQTSCSPSANNPSLRSQFFSRVQIIGGRGVGVGQLNKPRSVAVDLADNLYVVDMTGRVQKFSPDGTFLLSWQMPEIERGRPKGMCHDPQGNILVVEPHYSRVNLFSPLGKLLAQWGSHGTNDGQLSLPRGVAVNSQHEIFVSEYEEAERVQEYQFDSDELSSEDHANGARSNKPPRWIGGFGHAGTGPGEFNRPEGLCVDSRDRLYVADSCNHRIQIFSNDGKFLRAYGKPGKGMGELSYPYDICVDKAGRQYVCEFGNSRIQIFDAQDRPVEIIGSPGAEPGRFNNPWGVALDSRGNLYVADSQNHRVQKLVRKE